MKRLLALLVASAVLAAAPAWAHHSAAMFDGTKLVLLRGTVVSFTYLNPHSWIAIEGSPEGTRQPERWDIEATAPQSLARIGITATTLKPGERVTVAIRPLRDGRRAGSLVFFVLADGKAYGADPKDLGLDVAQLKP